MNITELDEFQGLTADMVREWLANLDPAIMPIACIADDIIAVSELCGETPQTLLREINPRMRKGWPSGEALSRHDRWIVSKPDGAVVMCRWRPPYMVNAAGGGDFALPEQCKQWSFWPCDANGNKVRWPEKDGVML